MYQNSNYIHKFENRNLLQQTLLFLSVQNMSYVNRDNLSDNLIKDVE